MIEIFKVFYSTHYNFAAFALLLLLFVILFLTKKNFKWALIFIAVDIVFNVIIFQKTSGKAWVITETPEKVNEWEEPSPVTYHFSAPDHWIITTGKGEKMHWCWVENYKERFLSINFVDKLWGTSKAKEMRQASEERLNQ